MHKVLHTGPAIPLRYVGIDLIMPLGNGSSRKGGAGNIGISSSRWTTIVGKARRESSHKIILLLSELLSGLVNKATGQAIKHGFG